MTARTNIEHFLGHQAARGGPFALLGITPERSDSAHVIAALELRLAQVNSHPHCDTPQGDEVRLSLHAAAAQLLDPVVRRHMLERWGVSDAPTAPAMAITTESLALERDAILTLAMNGGWNKASLRRLAILAHARGVPSHRVAETIRAIAHRRTPGAISPPSTPSPRATGPESPTAAFAPNERSPGASARAVAGARQVPRDNGQAPRPMRAPPTLEPMLEADEPTPSAARGVLLTMLAMVVLALVAIGVLTILIDSGDPGSESPASNGPSGPSPAGPAPPPEASPDPRTETIASGGGDAGESERAPGEASLADMLARAREALAIDPSRGEREVRAVIDRLERTWAALPPDQRISAHADLVDVLYRLGADASRGVAIASRIARASEDSGSEPTRESLLASIWSAGMLVRLSREADLPAQITRVIDDALSMSYAGSRPPQDATFERGAIDALARLARILSAPTPPVQDDEARRREAWDAWVLAALGATESDPSARTRLLLVALDDLLRSGPEGSRSAWAHAAASRLVEAIDWSKDSPSRRWLLAAFNAPSLSSSDLHVVTSALARLRGIDGLDPTMTLDAQASERARTQLRDAFAGAWGLLETARSDETHGAWANAKEQLDREIADALTPEEHLALAARMALLNEAGAWIWRGELDHARSIIENADRLVRDATDLARARARSLSAEPGGEWAVRYLSVRRNQQARLDLLDTLERSRSKRLTPMEAEVLTLEALRGSGQSVRERAHQVVAQFLDQPSVVNAFLEALPDAPETVRNARLISDAAAMRALDPRDPNWRIIARRGLVERLLELAAGETQASAIDRLSAIIARAYAASIAQGAPDAEIEAAPADQSAREARLRWRERASSSLAASRLSLDQIERDRSARVAGSRGPVQRFDAEQRAIVELMAYVVIAEQAGAADEALAILASLDGARRGSGHIFEQIAHNERAIADLWSIRLRD